MSTGSGGLSGTNGSVFTSSTRAGSSNIQLHQVAVQLGGTLALTVVSIFATALAVGGRSGASPASTWARRWGGASRSASRWAASARSCW